MYEILRTLPQNAHVLDLGSRSGSFGLDGCPSAVVVRLDTELSTIPGSGCFVQADAAYLPFRDASFDTVIANHVLEHVDDLPRVLQEIGRVVRPCGSLYVAVPDASTFTDHLYRWIYHGGGHINAFRSAEELTNQIARITSLAPVATRTLASSFGFLEKSHFHPRPPRRL
jgi:SAM-dependent methyltransferase